MTLTEHVAAIVVERLRMQRWSPAEFPEDLLLFAPEEVGGLDLDSLDALEIISALSYTFEHPFDDIAREDMATVASIAAYLRRAGRTTPVE